MKYVNLGSYKVKRREDSKSRLKLAALGIFVFILGYFIYLFWWPAFNVIKEVLKAPGSVISLIRNPADTLESTNGRVNFLILGIDKRSSIPYSYEGRDGKVYKNGFLSDTILFASVDLETKDTFLLSLPRDLWVKIDQYGYGKINAAYSIGETSGYAGGGLGLAKGVVEEHLGVPIHYSARLDFQAFEKAIDAIDGVEINIDRAFDDYNYPIEGMENAECPDGSFNCHLQHVHFDQGVQKMDGETALRYVRSRQGTNGEGTDFARAKRQQKVILAFRDKAVSLETLANPIKLSSLILSFGEGLAMDFDLNVLGALVKLVKDVDPKKVRTVTLETGDTGLVYSPPMEQYGGAYVLLPKVGWDKIKLFLKENLSYEVGGSN
ncbi:MAG: hypothetical protein A2Y57_02660 [Candidatus Woykebacteria bacterium RBG_13_40_7b]|uniref:Cell envelope-related transcriptional attenuator domain-containing protein n=1 Tax=Candidatus Woykebacteria bacterium RBG_13_40_7b TaxID=1802594 RepID=A0A1G1WBQ3_9BACT|nr:MAG: hypothetical protein A2Y57_02660 [Candidatus Woykebacteria bacterium RBG_13_40_7b]